MVEISEVVSRRYEKHRDDTENNDRIEKQLRRRRGQKRNLDRHRRSSSTEDSIIESMATWKTTFVVGVIGTCFVILYPKLFYPMLMSIMNDGNRRDFAPKSSGPTRPMHPDMSNGKKGDFNLRNGPHPGMRMAGLSQASQYAEVNRDSWSWMLPIYSVGVIIFLIYTLSKILYKPGHRRVPKYDIHYNSSRDRFQVDGIDYSDSRESDSEEELTNSRISRKDLRSLQNRLKQTEEAMNGILQQLEQVTKSSDPKVAEIAKKNTTTKLDQLSRTDSKGQMTVDEPDDNYLGDLENALCDFKNLSETYVKSTLKEQRKSRINDGNAKNIDEIDCEDISELESESME